MCYLGFIQKYKIKTQKRNQKRVLEMKGKIKTEGSPASVIGYVAKGLWDFGKNFVFGSYTAEADSHIEPYAKELERKLVEREGVVETSGSHLREIVGAPGKAVLGAKYDDSSELYVAKNPFSVLPGYITKFLEKSKVTTRAVQDSTIAHEYGHSFTCNESQAEGIGLKLLKYVYKNSRNGTARKFARNALIASSVINRFYDHSPLNDELGLDIGGALQAA